MGLGSTLGEYQVFLAQQARHFLVSEDQRGALGFGAVAYLVAAYFIASGTSPIAAFLWASAHMVYGVVLWKIMPKRTERHVAWWRRHVGGAMLIGFPIFWACAVPGYKAGDMLGAIVLWLVVTPTSHVGFAFLAWSLRTGGQRALEVDVRVVPESFTTSLIVEATVEKYS